MEKVTRNKFFGILGKGTFVAAILAAIPYKLFSNLSKSTSQKKIQIVVHPAAIKRNSKV